MNNIDFKQFLQIKENQNKGVPKLAPRKLTSKEYTILIDSRDRDRTVYPNSNEFIVKINNGDNSNATINYKYKNIKEIVLSSVVLPKRITSYSYLILDIEELNSTKIQGTNQHLNKAFAIMIPEQHDNPGDFVNCTVHYLDFQRHHFDPPLASMPNTLTINIRQPNGQLADLGIDNSLPLTPKDSVQGFFLFKIICEEEDFHQLNVDAFL